MSKLLADLLHAKQPLFSTSLKQLEKASGNEGVDVALTAEIVEKFKAKTKELGLDPKDSEGKEIYHALSSLAKEHDEHLAKQIGGSDPENVQELLPLMAKAAKGADMPKTCWALKKSVAKKMLKKNPPKKIMKMMGYSSIDSMLKNANVFEIFTGLRFGESDEWLNEFNEVYKGLKPSDFETREIELVVMDHDTWADAAEHFVEKKRHNITHSKEMGVIAMVPMKIERMAGITIKDLSLLFHYYNEVRLYSAFFKLQQVKPNFGEIIVETLIADPGKTAVMAGNEVHWRVIQRYFGKLKDEYHPEIFEPHVHPEDLHWRRAEENLYRIDPELKFWDELDYVAMMYEGRPLTMNLMDVGFGFSNAVSYEERYIYHFREALWNEVFMRYMGEEVLEDQILKQLDNDLIDPTDLAGD